MIKLQIKLSIYSKWKWNTFTNWIQMCGWMCFFFLWLITALSIDISAFCEAVNFFFLSPISTTKKPSCVSLKIIVLFPHERMLFILIANPSTVRHSSANHLIIYMRLNIEFTSIEGQSYWMCDLYFAFECEK